MSLHLFSVPLAVTSGSTGVTTQKENTNLNENAHPVENNQKSEIPPTEPLIEWQEMSSTNMTHAIDNLTHVTAKLLQTHMAIEHHLSVISKAIDRVAR